MHAAIRTAAGVGQAVSVFTIHQADCIEQMRGMPEASVDAVVTDPPYGIRFMGKAWDGTDIEARAAIRRAAQSHAPNAGPNGGHKSIAAEAGKYDVGITAMRAFQEFSEEWAREALRVLKPGGHLLSFSSPRTYHRMVTGIEDAGFEIRDQILWTFGTGFPKSHNLKGNWEGWGTAMKPAFEPIVMSRRPLGKRLSIHENVARYGTGALNIDGCRIATTEDLNGGAYSEGGRQSVSPALRDGGGGMNEIGATAGEFVQPLGRWPATIIHDGSDEVLDVFPDAPGQQGPISTDTRPREGQNIYGAVRQGRAGEASADSENKGGVGFKTKPGARRLDSGSAARFFYCAKTSPTDRHEGLVDPGPQFEHGATLRAAENLNAAIDRQGNFHPTVKPTDLMAYLVRLVTPPGGVVLDPFMGSGSTGKACMREGLDFIGIELDRDEDGTPLGYIPIARARIEFEHARVLRDALLGALARQTPLF